ncbi:MAG: diaminopimelate epimerase, partial [Rhodospirillaceae bacterium]|nr:diaminopimelate epimerase [Rhodospirillaceae bacterium]
MDTIPFIKMHGLGNDFVVIDARQGPVAVSAQAARAIADRHRGVGCDQIILIEPSADGLSDAFMRILNADGGEVAACGNATRCVASLLMAEKGGDHVVIETAAGLLDADKGGGELISVDMGRARLDWRDIPLEQATDTLHLLISEKGLSDGCAVNMGN